MSIETIHLSEFPEEIKNFLLKQSRSSVSEIHVLDQDGLVAVILPGKSVNRLSSAISHENITIQSDTLSEIPPKESFGIIEGILHQYQEIEDAYLYLLLTASAALVPQQSYLYGHNERVAILSTTLARQTLCSEQEINDIKLAALLHDIGEIIVPDQLLLKTSSLSNEDWNMIKEHPRVGADLVAKTGKHSAVVQIILSHHEKYDGSGYPQGLAGESIPIGARILCIADSYDAMTNCRLHRPPKTHTEAILEMKSLSSISYDPELLDLFIASF